MSDPKAEPKAMLPRDSEASAKAAAEPPGTADELSTVRRSPKQLAWSRFAANRLALGGAVLLVLMIAAVVFLPLVMDLDPTKNDLFEIRSAPSAQYWLGTDGTGRDVFARLVYGGRASLGIGLSAALLAVVIGTLIGATAGAVGGIVDSILMRTTDVFLAFPALIATIIIVGISGPAVWVIVLVFALFGWPQTARVVRGMVLTLREREFVQAARSFGANGWWLISRHLLPATLSQVAVMMTLEVAVFVLSEAALSFLGLGIQPPTPSWGNMLQEAQSITVISSKPWLWVPPGLAIAALVLSINFVGDGLRDALDPKQQR